MLEPLPTIFVVDDDPSVRRALARLLRVAGMNVEVFASAEAYLARTPFTGPGCLVLDIRMPGMSGLELQEQLARAGAGVPIIFLTGHGDVPSSVRAMKSGAIDYLQKPVDGTDLLLAIRDAVAKSSAMQSLHAVRETLEARIKTLTHREYEVMTFVISGLRNKEIAAELAVTEKTVKVHRSRVMQKLQVTSAVELARACELMGIGARSC